MEPLGRSSEVYFVKLDLTDATGALLSSNFYWQNVAQDDFTLLDHLPKAKLDVSATSANEAGKTLLTVNLQNNTQQIALMAHLQLHGATSGKRILPVFYSDNYLSLVPGESRSVTIEVATKDLAQEAPLLLLDGYNVDVTPTESSVAIRPNQNADPLHSPASSLVPEDAP
jgi:beta-mannosidase